MSLWEGMLRPHALQAKSSSGIFFHVVTPDRIPQFTIPSLDTHRKHGGSGEGMGQLEGAAWRSSSDLAVQDKHGSNSPCPKPAVQPNPDPAAWAALSLPHLPKVTTPYGFVTLGQSPQVTSEEAFFHSGSGHLRGLAAETRPDWQEDRGCCTHPGVLGAGENSQVDGGPRASSHKDGRGSPAYRTPAGLVLPRRCASPLRDIQVTDVLGSKEAEKREKRLLGVGYQRSSSSPELPAVTTRKNLFQKILRRHLVHPRQLKPVDFTLH